MQDLERIDLSVGSPEDTDYKSVYRAKASTEAVDYVNGGSVGTDRRSDWYWFRLPNGDLILGCYPLGHTYEKFEREYP